MAAETPGSRSGLRARTTAGAAMRRLAALCTLLAAWCLAMVSSAWADPRYAAMTVDANTGKVLYADGADEPRYPASLTKVMTLYIAFEQMQLGKLSPATMIRISPEAAAAPPSRSGLKAGATIALSDAIKLLLTKSANDLAIAVAEHIAGSEERFAELMTRKARALGMSHTTFRNAHGLPDPEQVTTARDMVTLALRLYDTFPREARAFSLRTFSYGGRNYRNHNTMLFNFAGMDGIKTGYTRVSGFNLLASVRRDGRHVIGVVFGGNTASARNARMRLLLTRAMQQASAERTRSRMVVAARPAAVPVPRPAPAARPQPDVAPRAPAPQAAAPLAEAPRLAEPVAAATAPADDSWRTGVRMAAPPASGSNSVATRVGAYNGWHASAEPHAAPRQPSTLGAQAARLAGGGSARGTATGTRHAAAGGSGSEIQIGAFADAAEARDNLASARRLSPRLLSDAEMAVPTVKVGGRTLYRARFVGLDAAAAASACAELRRHRIECLVTRTN